MVTEPDLQGHGGERQPCVRGLSAPGVASWPVRHPRAGRGGGQRGLNTPAPHCSRVGARAHLDQTRMVRSCRESSLSVARTYSSGVPAAKGRTGQGQKPTHSGEAEPSSAREEESGEGRLCRDQNVPLWAPLIRCCYWGDTAYCAETSISDAKRQRDTWGLTALPSGH